MNGIADRYKIPPEVMDYVYGGFLEVVAEDEARSYGRRDYARWEKGNEIAAPLALYQASVQPEWVDYNGHMSESFFLLAFGDASDALFRYIGIDEAYRNAGHSFYTVESHIN